MSPPGNATLVTLESCVLFLCGFHWEKIHQEFFFCGLDLCSSFKPSFEKNSTLKVNSGVFGIKIQGIASCSYN